MQLHHKAFRLGIFGASGTGKTTFAEKYLRGTSAEVRFIFDREGEWAHRLKMPQVGNHARMVDMLKTGWVLFEPDSMFSGRHEDAVEFFADWSLKVSARIPGRKVFVVDELQLLVSGHQIGPHVKTIIQTGRRYGVDFVLIGQAPNLIHNAVLGQLTEVVFFRLTNERALEFPQESGMDVEKIRNLPDWHYVARDMTTGAEVLGPSKTAEKSSRRRI